jgi:hypothetical protein
MRATLLEVLVNRGTVGGGLPLVGHRRGITVEVNWRWEHGAVVEGVGGEVDEHHDVKAKPRNAASSPGGG